MGGPNGLVSFNFLFLFLLLSTRITMEAFFHVFALQIYDEAIDFLNPVLPKTKHPLILLTVPGVTWLTHFCHFRALS